MVSFNLETPVEINDQPIAYSELAYSELHCLSNYSFLRGASHPHELVIEAKRQGYHSIAITDECSFSGIVKAWTEAKKPIHKTDYRK